MATDSTYNLKRDLPGVLHAAIDGGGCRSCNRPTQHPVYGHDGYCPVPALFTVCLVLCTTKWHGDMVEVADWMTPMVRSAYENAKRNDFLKEHMGD